MEAPTPTLTVVPTVAAPPEVVSARAEAKIAPSALMLRVPTPGAVVPARSTIALAAMIARLSAPTIILSAAEPARPMLPPPEPEIDVAVKVSSRRGALLPVATGNTQGSVGIDEPRSNFWAETVTPRAM